MRVTNSIPVIMTNQIHMRAAGWRVLRVWRGAIYIRIPPEYARPIDGGCQCRHCTAHPDTPPAWDTLAVPLKADTRGNWFTWTVHAPEWEPNDIVRD